MKIKIRKSVPADIPIAKKYLTEMWIMHAKAEPKLVDIKLMRTIFDPKVYRKWLKSKNKTVLIAEINGEVAGGVTADVQKIPWFFKDNKIIYVDDLYVVPKFRRMGVGKRLLKEVDKIAKRKGIKRLQSRIYTFNTPSRKLFESVGYHAPHMTYDKTLR